MRLDFELGTGPEPSSRPRPAGEQLTVLLAAGFGGRRGSTGPGKEVRRRIRAVDSDTRDTVFAGFGAELELEFPWAPGGRLRLAFNSLEDFHPDALLARIAPLADLLATRRQLDTANALAAAERLQAQLNLAPAVAEPPPTGTPPGAPRETTEQTLARLLGAAPPKPSPPPVSGLDSLIGRIIDGSSARAPVEITGKPAMVAAAETELGMRLRAILAHPGFRALENAWRGLDLLVSRCPDEERVRVYAADLGPEEMAADPAGLARLLRDTACGVLVCDRTFGNNTADLAQLATIARVCEAAGATFSAGAHPRLAACAGFDTHPDPEEWTQAPADDIGAAWRQFRAEPAASRVRLAAPRFLLRLGYGRAADAIEGFPFEEIGADPAHEAFPWGNPAFLVALALSSVFVDGDAAATMEGAVDIGELPVVRFVADGNASVKPCAEAWLSDRAVARLAAAGLTPVQAVRNTDRVRVHLAADPGR